MAIGVCSISSAGLTSSTLLATATVSGVLLIGSEKAEAQTVRMNTRQSVRSVARNTRQSVVRPASTYRNVRQTSRQVSRNTRQSVRQISRRHFYTLPAGYRWVTYGRYRYCFYGGRYYYPYIYGGRTVYIQVNVNSSNPAPPPSSQVIVNVN